MSIDTVLDKSTGYMFNEFPKNYSFFRADNSIYMNTYNREKSSNNIVFFGLDVLSVETYGMVLRFETTKPIRLLALDNLENMKLLYEKSPLKIQSILENNYGYSKTNIRDSVSIKDKELSKYLCENGFDGYAILSKMKTDAEGIFHSEVMICNPSTTIRIVEQITDESKREKLLQDERLRILNENEKEKRSLAKRQRQLERDDEPRHNNNIGRRYQSFPMTNFSKSLFDSPPHTPGGNHAILKKTRIKKSIKKSKKSRTRNTRKNKNTKLKLIQK